MDHSKIYKYRFDELKRQLCYGWELRRFYGRDDNQIFDIGGNGFRRYQVLVCRKEDAILGMVKRLIENIMDAEGIQYLQKPRYRHSFTIVEENGKVVYTFALRDDKQLNGKLEHYRKMEGICGVKIFFLQKNYERTIERLNNDSRINGKSFFEFYTIKDLFDEKFGRDEYPLFLYYAEQLQDQIELSSILGLADVPMGHEVKRFRNTVANILCKENYDALLPASLDLHQKRIIIDNYIANKRFLVMAGYAPFADSLVSSEWYYRIHVVNGELEQSGLVAGYIKSVEQLLYALISLFINTNRTIKARHVDKLPKSIAVYHRFYIDFTDENRSYIDTTLGAMTSFVKFYNNDILHRSDLFEVDENSVLSIVECLIDFVGQDDNDIGRNGVFHKRNLYGSEDVENVRKKAFVLYCLLLGSFHLDKEDRLKLMAYKETQNVPKTIGEEELFKIVMEWMQPILLFDMPKETQEIILQILKTDRRGIILYLEGVEKLTSDHLNTDDYRITYSSIARDNRLVIESNEELDEVNHKVLRVLDKLINTDNAVSSVLRRFETVKIEYL